MADGPDDRPDLQLGSMDYDFSKQIGYLLRRAYQRHLAIFQAKASDSQLTSVQFSTLCALHDFRRAHCAVVYFAANARSRRSGLKKTPVGGASFR